MTTASTILAEDHPRADRPSVPARSGENGGSHPRRSSPFQGAGASYILVASALLGLGLGYLMDAWRKTTPGWTIGLFFFFMAVGTYHMIKESRR